MFVSWVAATVVDITAVRPGVQEVTARTAHGEDIPALAYTDLVGEVAPGHRVPLNVGAYRQHLGTGGFAFVGAPDLDAIDAAPPAGADTLPGHLVKARYTPTQASVTGPEEPGRSAHRGLVDADDLGGLVVVVADLHSALPAILAGIRAGGAVLPVSYVMTDGAALPLAFSRTVAGLLEAGWLDATVTTGQAFGGTDEAVSVHSGLLVARHVQRARVAVVTQGPGNLGAGTRWGFSGVAAGEVVNAAAELGGRPVAGLRVSSADPRPRHRGLSHHSLTAYGRVAVHRARVALPDMSDAEVYPPDLAASIRTAARPLGVRHDLVTVPVEGLLASLRDVPVPLTSMGRDLDADPAAFVTSAAAGRLAASLADAH